MNYECSSPFFRMTVPQTSVCFNIYAWGLVVLPSGSFAYMNRDVLLWAKPRKRGTTNPVHGKRQCQAALQGTLALAGRSTGLIRFLKNRLKTVVLPFENGVPFTDRIAQKSAREVVHATMQEWHKACHVEHSRNAGTRPGVLSFDYAQDDTWVPGQAQLRMTHSQEWRCRYRRPACTMTCGDACHYG